MPPRKAHSVPITLLGQSGCRIEYSNTVVYMDPYLSNSVQELDSDDLARLIPIPVKPEDVTDADWVLITHSHIDHCDPHTIPKLASASPNCRFIAPQPVINKLSKWGIDPKRCQAAHETWTQLGQHIRAIAIPAAHPKIRRTQEGLLTTVGFMLEIQNSRIYLAGDTSIHEELINALKPLSPVTTAILPVNEHNYFRGQRGIIGNMSIREAFVLADMIGCKTMIPVHWDMFEANSVDPEEIRAVYQRMKPDFELEFSPTSIKL